MDLKCSKRELNVQIKWFHKWRVRVSDLGRTEHTVCEAQISFEVNSLGY